MVVDSKGDMPPAPPDTSKQPTLRVMRLYKPRLDSRRVLPSCSFASLPPSGSSAVAAAAAEGGGGGGGGVSVAGRSHNHGDGDFALSSALKLPDSFGNIYRGETFTAYISVLNHMASTVLGEVSLTAKLQSPSGRVDLDDQRSARGASVSRPNPAPLLVPSDNLDMIVEHKLQELGVHTLKVTVKYQVTDAVDGPEPRSMRKFYRFSVMNPMEISSVCSVVKSSPFVEVQLVNTTQMDLLLDSCDFISEHGVEASLVGGEGDGDPLGASPWIDVDEASSRGTGAQPGAGVGGAGRGEGGRVGGSSTLPRSRWWRGVATARGDARSPEGTTASEGQGRDGGCADEDSCLLTAVERFDGRVLLHPQESHQLMYSVRSKTSSPVTAARAPAAVEGGGGDGLVAAVGRAEEVEERDGEGRFEEGRHTLGRVRVCWRTTTGESGGVDSDPVVFESPDRPEVEVTVAGLPDVLKLGKVVECVATVRNRSRRPMTLQLQFRTDGMMGVYVHGQSFRNLGEILPGKVARCPLQLLALVAGLHELQGCTVVDMHTAQEFSQGKLRDILVEFPDDDDDDDGDGDGDGDRGGGEDELVMAGSGDGGVLGL